MRFARRCLGWVSGIALAAAPARAHVAPAQDQNNRYIKVLPFADRVRIAYTVFYGQGPGHAMRASLDADHDGIVSDGEAHAYGVQLGAQVAAALDVEVDGVRWPVRWDEISVGLGVPDASAGAWSVDLIAWPCSAGAGGVHHVVLRDRYDLPIGGETELWVLDMPNIVIDRARVGAMDDPTHDFQFSGPPTVLAKDGLELTYTADAHAGRGSGGACAAADADARDAAGGSRLWMLGAAVAGGLLGVGAMLWTRRRARS